MTPLLRTLLLLAFASCPALLLPACDASDDDALPPPGFDPAWTSYVRLDAPRAREATLPLDEPLYDPSGLAIDPGPHPDDGLPSLLVAEAKAWRVRRYPITRTSPPTLGAPQVTLTATPDVPGAAWLPTHLRRDRPQDTFGRILEADADGTRLLSDAHGDLWLLHPDLPAPHRLGAGPGGLPPAHGTPLRDADLSRLAAALIAPASPDGAPRALLLATPTQLFAADLDPLLQRLNPTLRLVAGSGASGALLDGTLARRAPLHLGAQAALTADPDGNLALLETAGARLLWLPRWRHPEATLHILAGGGRSILYTEIDPRDAFLTLTPVARPLLRRRDDQLEVTFPVTGIPFRMTFTPHPDDGRPLDRSRLAFLDVPQFNIGNIDALGEHLLYTDRDTARVLTGPDPALPLTGPTNPSPFLPKTPLRPALAVTYTARGQDGAAVLLQDAATAVITPTFQRGQLSSPLPYQPPGAEFGIPATLAFIPGTDDLLEQLLTASATRLDARLVQEATSGSRLGASGDGPLPGDATRLRALHTPATPRLAAGWPRDDQGLLLFDTTTHTLLRADTDLPDPELEQVAGGFGRPRLPLDEPIGRNSLDLQHLHTLHAHQGLALANLHTPRQGDLLVLLTGRPASSRVAGLDPGNDRAALLAGGGPLPPAHGRHALEVGLAGLSDAALLRRRPVFLTDERGTAALWTLDDDQRLVRLNPRPRDPDATPLQALAPAHPARLWRLGCDDDTAELLLRDALGQRWRLDPDAQTLTPDPGDEPLGAGCLQGQPLLVERHPDGAVSAGDLDLPPDTAAAVTTPDALLLLRTQPRPAVWSLTPGGSLQQRSALGAPTLHRRSISDADLADDLPAFAGAPGGPLWGLTAQALFRLVPSPVYERNTPLEVLWTGPPLDPNHPPRALAASPDLTALYAILGDALYRYDLPDIPLGAHDGANAGAWQRVAGGGPRPATPGTPAAQADFAHLHALAFDPQGRLWLRWDRYLGYIAPDGRLIAVAGGGDLPPHRAAHPWHLRLTSTSAFQSPLAFDDDGHALLAEPAWGAVLGLAPTPPAP